MSSPDRKDVLTPVTDAMRTLAAGLLSQSRHGYLAVLDPEDGWPQASRVALGSTQDGVPLILISRLSAHFAALEADPRCCLLVGEPGKGDPLAHARISMDCTARQAPHEDRAGLRARFVAWQPKAALYVDFADFAFWYLQPQRARLNAGFGKASALDRDELLLILQQVAALP